MSKRNARPLDTIADHIHRLERKNVFEIGDLLLEARAQCKHGEWMEWLKQFGWAWDTADRYAAVAELGAKFRKLRNLKVPTTTLYDLLDREDDLPSIIEELSKRATTAHLTARDAQRLIQIGIGRHRFGDYPDATLVLLAAIGDEPWSEEAIAALKDRSPEDDKGAKAIADRIEQAYLEPKRKAAEDALYEIDREIARILDGDPPDLPPSTPPTDSQKLSASTEWAEVGVFADAVTALHSLRAKPMRRFVGKCSPADLHDVAEFLIAISEATKAQAA